MGLMMFKSVNNNLYFLKFSAGMKLASSLKNEYAFGASISENNTG